jgi:hypothetical protein
VLWVKTVEQWPHRGNEKVRKALSQALGKFLSQKGWMSKTLHHRLARWLRLAVGGAFVFHGMSLPGMVAPLYAQNSDTITLTVSPKSNVPPAAVADLLASANPAVQGQISLTWTAPQGNVGGTPIPNLAVASYSIRYATFSVASLGGNTAAWWALAAPSNIVLQPPTYTPQTPGQLEAYALSGLVPGTRYYFSIQSVSPFGAVSPIDTESASPALQANAIATIFFTSGNTPLRPNGLSMSSNAGQFIFKWHPVTLSIDGVTPVNIDHYIVSRYDAIDSSPTASFSVPAISPSYTDTVGGLTYFYRAVAVTVDNIQSPPSDYVDSSSQLNRYALAPAESDTRMTLPMSVAQDLNLESNGTTDDYELVAIHQPQNENTTTLKSYLFQVQNARTGQIIPGFSFSEAIAQVQVSYALSNAVITQQRTLASSANQGAQAQAVAQLISLYWFNGSDYIRLGGTVLLDNQALAVTAKNVGLYNIQAVSSPTSFALTKGSPYPRVITPNGAENHRVFWFFDNPSGEQVTGTIYDIRGAKVRDLTVSSQSPTPNSLVWDGRSNNGSVVPSGVYLYKIQAGKETQTGTVVVAR